MKKIFSLLCLLLTLTTNYAFAEEQEWSFTWNTSRSDGGEGFYHITSNDDTTQVATLNTLQWTYEGNTSVTAFTGSAGQYFGSAKNPVTHATLSTSLLHGSIKTVTIQAKKKEGTEVSVGVSVNGENYICHEQLAEALTTDWDYHTFIPLTEPQDGKIVITMDQTSETTGPIYFLRIFIFYEGDGVERPEIERADPELEYEEQVVIVEKGDYTFANDLFNPYDVGPISYTSGDPSLAIIDTNGDIYTTGIKTGSTTVTATFAGNYEYLPDTATYTLTVVERSALPQPTIDLPEGTYTEAKQVTISSDNPNCKAIWYSTVAADSASLIDDPIIVFGNTATITLDESCTLRCCAVGNNLVGCIAERTYQFNIGLEADFTAEECKKIYYQMGWDSIEEASTWKYYGIHPTNYWTLTEAPSLWGTQPFSTIDPASQYSLSLMYSASAQRERAVSPAIEILPNSTVEFYACFSGVWLVFANWALKVTDMDDGTETVLVDGFKWAQANAFTGPRWVRFQCDLSHLAGKTCQFEFLYEGANGDDMSIDGFKLLQENQGENTQISILQGESVHFRDLSIGHPTAWAWSFEGASTPTSSEQNPVVTYNQTGTFSVSLTVSKEGDSDTCTKEQFVVVNVEAPAAHIGLPEEAYLSPWAAAFVPAGKPLTFTDASTGHPDTWAWTFEGTDIATSDEQNPTVTYTTEGQYGLDLTVSNAAGSDRDFLVNAIKAGGACDIWNIEPEENSDLVQITMGWYGNYAGSNWLGMTAFAEKFHAPSAEASIDKVTVYFANTVAENKNAKITAAICKADAQGNPGDALAETSLKVSELACDKQEVVPTDFLFAQPVEVEGDFFVQLSGFPNEGATDDVAVFCVLRGVGQRNSVYHLLEDEDANYQPLGTYTWFANTDDPLSMAVTAHLQYNNAIDNLDDLTAPAAPAVRYNLNGYRTQTDKGLIIEKGRIIMKK